MLAPSSRSKGAVVPMRVILPGALSASSRTPIEILACHATLCLLARRIRPGLA